MTNQKTKTRHNWDSQMYPQPFRIHLTLNHKDRPSWYNRLSQSFKKFLFSIIHGPLKRLFNMWQWYRGKTSFQKPSKWLQQIQPQQKRIFYLVKQNHVYAQETYLTKYQSLLHFKSGFNFWLKRHKRMDLEHTRYKKCKQDSIHTSTCLLPTNILYTSELLSKTMSLSSSTLLFVFCSISSSFLNHSIAVIRMT